MHERKYRAYRDSGTKPETSGCPGITEEPWPAGGTPQWWNHIDHRLLTTDIRGKSELFSDALRWGQNRSPWLNYEGKHHETWKIASVILSELRAQDSRHVFLYEKGCWHFYRRAEESSHAPVREAETPMHPPLLACRNLPHAHETRGWCENQTPHSPTRPWSHVQQERGLL